MTNQDQEITHLQELRTQHRNNIRKLEKQLAIYPAGEEPVHLLNKLESEQRKLGQVVAQLEALTAQAMPERPRGPLPPIFHLPHPRNPNFTGRHDLLTRLRTALTSGQPAALTQAIHGLGGVGKTQLAVEYAYRHAAGYTLVWWVRAEPATLTADYAALATPLGLPEKDHPEQPVVVEAVCHWFTQHPGWLLVFDNAPDQGAVRPYLPQGAAGHVLITSRDLNWELANPLTVPVWPRDESIAFLHKRTGKTDQAAADKLADALGDLPLALAQVGAYVRETGATFTAYLDLFQTRRTELWKKERPPLDYPDTVETTWHIAFQQVRETSPAAADLLNLCAYLAPDDIPHDLLSQGTEHLPQPLSGALSDPLAFDEAVAALRRYALLERSGDTLSLHRLVQAVARDRLPPAARPTWAAAAVQIVDDAFPSGDVPPDDVRTWPVCACLLPHALAAAGHAEALQVASEATGRLLNQAGLYLQGRAQFAEARAAYERALAIGEATLGPDHPTVAIRVNNLGMVLKDLGDLDGAREAFQRALAIWEKQLGPEHPQVATGVNNLGLVLKDLGDLAGARAAFQRALAIFEKVLGADHPNVATLVNNLGSVLQALGDLAGAREAFQRALAIWEKQLGSEHPQVATGVNNLGGVLKALGDLAGAREALQRALAIWEKQLGPEHPQVATGVNNLGSVLQDLGDLAGARAAFQRALAIDEAAFGPHHPTVAIHVNNLGSVLQALGDLAGAREAFQRALAIWEATLPPGHQYIEIARENLASLPPE